MKVDNRLTKILAREAQTEVCSFGGTVPTKLFLSEQSDGFLLRVCSPSVRVDSYQIEIKQGHLVISSFVEIAEYRIPRFMQAFPILPHLDSSRIEARSVDGELQIFAPFKDGSSSDGFNRQIDIDL